MPTLESVNVGKPAPLAVPSKSGPDRTVLSSIVKRPVDGVGRATSLGLDGDQQADPGVHGGRDKAVNVYPAEHYAYFSDKLQGELGPGGFGENFTTHGLLEGDVAIGDHFRIGSATFQVTQPRQPCFKLAARHRESRLVKWVRDSGRTGFYFRVTEIGEVEAGDEIERIDRPATLVTVAEANELLYSKQPDRAKLGQLLTLDSLSDAWREELETLAARR